jgi:hypothetical protein
MSSLERFGDREMRIGNNERGALTDLLRSATDQGYLDLEEYEKRVDVVMSAKTAGDATVAVADLPAFQKIIEAQEPVKVGTPDWIKWMWVGFGIPIGICVAIWLVIYLTTDVDYFWPMWVIAPLVGVGVPLTLGERFIQRPARERHRKEELRRKRMGR